MLRAFFIWGAIVLLGAIGVAPSLLWLGRWMGIDLSTYVSTAVWALLLVWIAAIIGGITLRVTRRFIKPS
jgi:hypothetical protein